jgi:hypothetical protein
LPLKERRAGGVREGGRRKCGGWKGRVLLATCRSRGSKPSHCSVYMLTKAGSLGRAWAAAGGRLVRVLRCVRSRARSSNMASVDAGYWRHVCRQQGAREGQGSDREGLEELRG